MQENDELHSLLAEPLASPSVITIQCIPGQKLRPEDSASCLRPASKQRRCPLFSRNPVPDSDGNICAIPSIPTSKRKYGYFESVTGTLYPLVDAYQFLREDSVLFPLIKSVTDRTGRVRPHSAKTSRSFSQRNRLALIKSFARGLLRS